jgi:hypothetical protein
MYILCIDECAVIDQAVSKKTRFLFFRWLLVLFFLGGHPQTSTRCNAAGKLFAVCAFEVSEGIYLSSWYF